MTGWKRAAFTTAIAMTLAGCGGGTYDSSSSGSSGSPTLAQTATRDCSGHGGVQQLFAYGGGGHPAREIDVVCHDGSVVNAYTDGTVLGTAGN